MRSWPSRIHSISLYLSTPFSSSTFSSPIYMYILFLGGADVDFRIHFPCGMTPHGFARQGMASRSQHAVTPAEEVATLAFSSSKNSEISPARKVNPCRFCSQDEGSKSRDVFDVLHVLINTHGIHRCISYALPTFFVYTTVIRARGHLRGARVCPPIVGSPCQPEPL